MDHLSRGERIAREGGRPKISRKGEKKKYPIFLRCEKKG